jgi:hypothetical protein
MDKDYVKSLIQQALWNEYLRTGNADYEEIYKKWYENYEKIIINLI